jgi:23S rRNA pseudouridine1911/1915/1917 synthase
MSGGTAYTMKNIPFYHISTPGMHGIVAAYRTLYHYFLNQKISEEEIEDLMGDSEDVTTQQATVMTAMAQQGFDIRVVGPAASAYRQIPDFLKLIQLEDRPAVLKDLDKLLLDDRLVTMTVNGKILEGKTGSSSRTIVVLQRKGESYMLHDTSRHGEAYLTVSRHTLWEAMGAEGGAATITGFIYRRGNSRRRLDMYVLDQKPRLSRAFAAKLIEQGKVLVNGKQAKVGYRVQDHDDITIDYDEAALDNIPDIDLPIIYEDEYCFVINKPAGVLTHAQGALVHEATVATFLRNRAPDMHGERAGIVHRLDRATSGVIVVAKSAHALSYFQKQFADRTVSKTYMAVVEGTLRQGEAVISMPIERNPKAPATFRAAQNGKPAITQYKVVEENADNSLVELRPKTGRTHQLRVHLSQIGHPIVGDPLYGSGSFGDRLYLHALSLEITLPNGDRKTFAAPLPPEFKERMAA